MQTSISKMFTDHPHAVGESYGEHFGVAMSYAGKLFLASCAAFVHALLPFLFVILLVKLVFVATFAVVAFALLLPLIIVGLLLAARY